MNNNKDQMHPQDVRNLIIFAIASLAIWFLYETYILAPQAKALHEAKKSRAELVLKDPSLLMEAPKVKRGDALAKSPRLYFENDEVSGSIALIGGAIDDLSLNKYFQTLEKKEKVHILTPDKVEGARYINYGWVSGDRNLALPNASTQWQVKDNDRLRPDIPVTLFWDNGQGLRFERVLSLDKNFVFTIKQKVINNSGENVYLHPYSLVTQTGIPPDAHSRWIAYEGPMGFIGGELVHMSYPNMVSDPNKKIEAQRGWIGFSDKFWLTALMPQQDQMAKYRFKYTPDIMNKDHQKYQTDFTGSEMLIDSGSTGEYSYRLYAGAKKVLLLEQYQKDLQVDNLDLAVDFGWFWFLTYPFFFALHYLGLLVGNMGVAIIILTICLRSAVFPLTRISYHSFAKMKMVAPQITELRNKYNDDKEKLQAEIVKLYQKEGVNPMSGCLPIIAQIPIFFSFYKVILTTIEIRHAPFFGWIHDLSSKDPTSIFNAFGFLNFDVSFLPTVGVWPCLMLLAMLVQKRLNPPPQDANQRMMMNIFPFFITFVMSKFASGLVIYWTISATMSVMQQAYIMRSLGVPIYIVNKDKFKEEAKKKSTEGPDVHPLIEMTEDEVEKAMFGDGEGAGDAPDEPTPDITPPKPKKKKKKK
tara:strand:+ start:1404 stop:3326 length:1923 start_codon:yes stop_codon:yes gene_type:complete